MIDIISFAKQGFGKEPLYLELTNIEEVSDSFPRFFIATLGRNNTQLVEKKNQTKDKMNQTRRVPKEIKVFLIQNADLNQYSLFTIFKLENSYLDLINFITNFIMCRTDGFIFTITLSGMDSFQKLKRKICIKNNDYSLSQLISGDLQVNTFEKDCETLLYFELEINSSQFLDFNTFISSSLKTFNNLIVILSESCQSLKDLSLEGMHSQSPSELVQFLQRLINL